jgi:putative ABC transport system ATP-binding protein
MKIIEAKQVTKTYTVDHREIRVLDDISLSVSESEFLVVEGSSGSGKTTLLSLLSGLDKPTSGRVFLQEKDITDKSEDDLAQLRKDMIGFVFQSFHLIPKAAAAHGTRQKKRQFSASAFGRRDAAGGHVPGVDQQSEDNLC